MRKHSPDTSSWIVAVDDRLFNLRARHLRVHPFAKIVYRGQPEWSSRDCLRGIVPGHVVSDWKVAPCVVLYHDVQLFPVTLPRLARAAARYGVAAEAAEDLLARVGDSHGVALARAMPSRVQ